MNKKWTLLLLAIVLLCSNVVFATKFSDVRGHWAESAITWSEEQGLLNGYEDGSFHSEKTITRAEWRKENSSWGNRPNSSSLGQRGLFGKNLGLEFSTAKAHQSWKRGSSQYIGDRLRALVYLGEGKGRPYTSEELRLTVGIYDAATNTLLETLEVTNFARLDRNNAKVDWSKIVESTQKVKLVWTFEKRTPRKRNSERIHKRRVSSNKKTSLSGCFF